MRAILETVGMFVCVFLSVAAIIGAEMTYAIYHTGLVN